VDGNHLQKLHFPPEIKKEIRKAEKNVYSCCFFLSRVGLPEIYIIEALSCGVGRHYYTCIGNLSVSIYGKHTERQGNDIRLPHALLSTFAFLSAGVVPEPARQVPEAREATGQVPVARDPLVQQHDA